MFLATPCQESEKSDAESAQRVSDCVGSKKKSKNDMCIALAHAARTFSVVIACMHNGHVVVDWRATHSLLPLWEHRCTVGLERDPPV